MKFRVLLRNGKPGEEQSGDMDSLVNELRERIPYIHSLETDDIIDFLDSVSAYWEKNLKKDFGTGLNHIIDTLKKDNLTVMLDTALRDRHALDGFVKLNSSRTLYHAQPRGLAVHWVAGNVPILGIFSIFQSMLTKNVNLVKASSTS